MIKVYRAERRNGAAGWGRLLRAENAVARVTETRDDVAVLVEVVVERAGAFVSASHKGWAYACEHPDEAAEIVYKAGSSVSSDHQAYMAKEVVKLCQTDTKGNTVTDYGHMDDEALQQTLDLAKQYMKLDDSAAAAKLAALTLDDIRDASFLTGDLGTPEKKM